MSTDDVRVILERSADRLERNWCRGGQTVFNPPENPRSLHDLRWVRPLCLMDTIAREVTNLAADQTEGGNVPEFLLARSLLIQAIMTTALPALLTVITDDVFDNWDSYVEKHPRLREEGEDARRNALRTLRRGRFDHRVWTYNDAYCQGGEHAAGIVRKAIKAL